MIWDTNHDGFGKNKDRAWSKVSAKLLESSAISDDAKELITDDFCKDEWKKLKPAYQAVCRVLIYLSKSYFR